MIKQPMSALAGAAENLEDELRRFERLAEQIDGTELTSGRNLERVAKQLQEVADLDDRLTDKVKTLVAAVTEARDRQQRSAQRIHERALFLQERTSIFQELLKRYEEIGKEAGALNESLQDFARRREAQKSGSPNADLVGRLQELQEQMGRVAGSAEELTRAAEEKEFTDLARQADSIRQQLLAAKNKMGLLHKGLSAEA